MKKAQWYMMKLVSTMFLVMATCSVNVACRAYIGQDEIPDNIKSLRKF